MQGKLTKGPKNADALSGDEMPQVDSDSEKLDRLFLPCENPDEWSKIERILRRPLIALQDLDALLTEFALNSTKQTCHFFSKIPASDEANKFDFHAFWTYGVPFMVEVALEMPKLFEATHVPLLLKGEDRSVTLTRRQCACLLSHSFFGSITADARRVQREKWAFRAAQLFFLEAIPSALCFLNYFKTLGKNGIPEGSLTYERAGFPRGAPPWRWDGNPAPMCPIELRLDGAIEDSTLEHHADFANKFVGGGCLENDFHMEEALFAAKPELIVAMALFSYMRDEEAVRIAGALQFSSHSGFASSFQFQGDYDGRRPAPPPTVCAMDALQGCARIQFARGLVLRDLNKARVAFAAARSVATGNWGCGAFGNDHALKFLQQWLAASDAGAERVHYHTFGDARGAHAMAALAKGLAHRTVGEVWAAVAVAADAAAAAEGPGGPARFTAAMLDFAAGRAAGGRPAAVQAGGVESAAGGIEAA
jgi:poly(ADP-ribose) glycohydrolase